MFSKILIAGRGESALRILRSCQELGIATVAAHSEADDHAMHVRLADESVCIGPAPARQSYLDQAAVIGAAMITDVDAIHPGIGFLSENAEFADKVREHGLAFIGPSAEHIRTMGDKIAARNLAKEIGLPVVPGSAGALSSPEEARALAKECGYPVLLKAAAGGGGRGMQVVESADQLEHCWILASGEAEGAFNDGRLYLEKFIRDPRHIEVQILGDTKGSVIHLGERDCSIQRRNQKLLEETPSAGLPQEVRERLLAISVEAMQNMGYDSAGTLEFVYGDGKFYFIEMNTRIQVEHTITEAITGLDLVREQIKIAYGAPLALTQDQVSFTGHAIECRVNAEHPETFMPSPGHVRSYHPAGGAGVRMDSALYSGYSVPIHYDSLVAKLIVWGQDRDHAIARTIRALDETVVDGIETTLPLFRAILQDAEFRSGQYDTGWLERSRNAGRLTLNEGTE